ncbi:MAG: MBG domain-containing protein [Kiritimatiellae bacterium]|nr:MBG domain-containing protein [Kiritimatiellia bacterium]
MKTILLFLACLAPIAHVQAEPAEVFFDTNSLTQLYNGSPCSVVVTTQPASLAVQILYEGDTNAPTEAGYYEVLATVIEPGWTGSNTDYLAIDRAPQNVQFILPETIVATSAIPLSASATSGQIPAFGVISGPGEILEKTLFFTNQGECVVAACVNGNENWRDACTAVTVQVRRAAAKISLLFLSQDYDGNPIEPLVLTEPDDLTLEVTYDGSATPPVNAGTYTVNAWISDPQWSGAVTGLLEIAKGTQLMDFTNPGICARTNTPELLAATTAELPAEFTVVEGPASLFTNNGTVYAAFSSTGQVAIAASHPGTVNRLPAPAVTNTFLVFENPTYIDVDDDIAIYDGAQHPISLILPEESGLTSNDVLVTYSGSVTPPTNAGNYNLVALITNPPTLHGGHIGEYTIIRADDEVTFTPPEEIVATQRIALVATTLSKRTCLYYAEPDNIAYIDDDTNLVFIASGDAMVCAFVNDDDNWIATDNWAWITAAKANATIRLANLFQPCDGTPRIVTAQTEVSTVDILYNGSSQPPSAAGRYTVTGILDNPLYQGGATGTLIVLERPEITLAGSTEPLQITWPAEPDLYYSVQLAAPNFTAWNDLPPLTNLTGNGSITVTLPTEASSANFRIIAYP